MIEVTMIAIALLCQTGAHYSHQQKCQKELAACVLADKDSLKNHRALMKCVAKRKP